MAISGSLDAWIRTVDVPDHAVESLVGVLAAVDVHVCPGPPHNAGPRNGIIVFEQPTQQVVDVLHAVTTHRYGQVIAVALTPSLNGDPNWQLLSAGASDVCTWTEADQSGRHVAQRLRRWRKIDQLLDCAHVREFLIGDSPVWQRTTRQAVEAAYFTDAPVLITGESGTGKERVAQLIHQLDPRPNKREFVVLDCSTVVPSLSGSEFFGHEKGAFTGAATAREGAFELADGGTLFLDEVGELPVTLQAELLRVIQEGTFKRVGSNLWRKSTFRLVCATNRDLTHEQAHGRFRSDFYYRIAGCAVRMPSLRERTTDIIPLFTHFFRQAHPNLGGPVLDDTVRDLLMSRAYPGNVRDLRSLTLRIAHRHLGDGYISVGDVPETERPEPGRRQPTTPDDGLRESVRECLSCGMTDAQIQSLVSQVAHSSSNGFEHPLPWRDGHEAAHPN